MRNLTSVWRYLKWFIIINIEKCVFILPWSFDHLIWAERKKRKGHCKSLIRGLFVMLLQRRNPAHMDIHPPSWDACQFFFYLRGTMSWCAACVGTLCGELKEKCQYRVGGQSCFTHTQVVHGGMHPYWIEVPPVCSACQHFLWNRGPPRLVSLSASKYLWCAADD